GLSPHQPRQASSGHGPLTGPNMFLPMIQAPTVANPCWAMSLSTPVSPSDNPRTRVRKARVGKNHSCSASPRIPSGVSRLCSGPQEYPSKEMERLSTLSFDIGHSEVLG